VLTRLPDGTRVIIRRIQPEDKVLLARTLPLLSAETVRRRFLSPKPTLSAGELRYLTEVDGESHVAFVALPIDRPDPLLGVGRYVRLPDDPATAEVAVLIGDPYQGHGLGTRMGLLLADHAREHGVRRFAATMLSDNVPAHRLFAKISDHLSTDRQGGLDEVVGELAA
jgi:RimJ/RimL family protein N-acetyltransferase